MTPANVKLSHVSPLYLEATPHTIITRKSTRRVSEAHGRCPLTTPRAHLDCPLVMQIITRPALMLPSPLEQCKPVLVKGEYVCANCGWGEGLGITAPFPRNCRIAPSLDPEDLVGNLIREYKCRGCKRNNERVARSVFAERARHCDKCEDREELVCLLAPANICELAMLLTCPHATCPDGLWAATERPTPQPAPAVP